MRKCPVCQTDIRGRKDKIYRSLNCKSAHQYDQRQENKSERVYNINMINQRKVYTVF